MMIDLLGMWASGLLLGVSAGIVIGRIGRRPVAAASPVQWRYEEGDEWQ